MKMFWLPFREEMKQKILEGKKDMTTRSMKYCRKGNSRKQNHRKIF